MIPSFRSGEVSTSRGPRSVLFVSAAGLHHGLETGDAASPRPDLNAFADTVEGQVDRRRPHCIVITDPQPVDSAEWASVQSPVHEERAQVLARRFIDELASLYRRVAALGCAPVIHAGLSDGAATLRMASTEICGSTHAEAGEVALATTWVLRHAVFFVALSERGVCERVLPRHFESAALRRRRSLDMLSTLRRLEQVAHP